MEIEANLLSEPICLMWSSALAKKVYAVFYAAL